MTDVTDGFGQLNEAGGRIIQNFYQSNHMATRGYYGIAQPDGTVKVSNLCRCKELTTGRILLSQYNTLEAITALWNRGQIWWLDEDPNKIEFLEDNPAGEIVANETEFWNWTRCSGSDYKYLFKGGTWYVDARGKIELLSELTEYEYQCTLRKRAHELKAGDTVYRVGNPRVTTHVIDEPKPAKDKDGVNCLIILGQVWYRYASGSYYGGYRTTFEEAKEETEEFFAEQLKLAQKQTEPVTEDVYMPLELNPNHELYYLWEEKPLI